MTVVVAVVTVVLAAVAGLGVALDHAPRRTTRCLARVPWVGSAVTTECVHCSGLAFAPGAEELPVDFRPEPGHPVRTAVTVRLCRRCSVRLSSRDRVRILREYAADASQGRDPETGRGGE